MSDPQTPDPKPFVPEPLPAEQARLLRQTVFGPGSPGPVVHDFQVLLEAVGEAGVEAGGKYNLLPIKMFKDLNSRMHWQAAVELQRPQLHCYPNLQGLNLLARATGLLVVRGAGEKARLVRDPSVYDDWMKLNDAEKYFTLLDAWLLHARATMIGQHAPRAGYLGDIPDDLGDALLGDSLVPYDSLLAYVFHLWHRVGDKGKKVSQKKRADANSVMPLDQDRYTLVLMALFGMLQVEQGKPIKGRPWVPTAICRTPFGQALMAALGHIGELDEYLQDLYDVEEGDEEDLDDEDSDDEEDLDDEDDLDDEHDAAEDEGDEIDAAEDGDEEEESDDEEGDDEEEEAEDEETADASPQGDEPESICFDDLQPLLQPYVPAWQQGLCIPGGGSFRDGVFVYKASLEYDKDVWRRIAAPARATLTDLAYAVLDAYRFDDDHLWSFYYRDRFGNQIEAQRELSDESENVTPTDEILVGKVPLEVGGSMVFHFDYGDDWRFNLLLEKIDPPNDSGKPGKSRRSKSTRPKLLEKHGKAPRQYPNWDE